MILFLDDNILRTRRFKSNLPSAQTAETADEMIALLEKHKSEYIKYVFLDHDLGGITFQNSKEKNCGYEVVRWLKNNKMNIGLIVVHSHNEPAAVRMTADLIESGYNVERIGFIHLQYKNIADD